MVVILVYVAHSSRNIARYNTPGREPVICCRSISAAHTAKATEGTSSMTWRPQKAMPGTAITERPTAIAASGLTQHRASK